MAKTKETTEGKAVETGPGTLGEIEALKAKIEALEQDNSALQTAVETGPGTYEVGKIGSDEAVIQNVRADLKGKLKSFAVKHLEGGKVACKHMAKALDESFAKSIVIEKHRLPTSAVLVVDKA